MRNPVHSGWHLIVDAICDPDSQAIASLDTLRQFMTDMVEVLDMEILDGPRMTEVDLDPAQLETDSDDGGITGYCLITTSHLSIHTWPLRNRFCLDIFSCKPFDQDAALTLIRNRLGVVAEEVTRLERRWPTRIPAAI